MASTLTGNEEIVSQLLSMAGIILSLNLVCGSEPDKYCSTAADADDRNLRRVLPGQGWRGHEGYSPRQPPRSGCVDASLQVPDNISNEVAAALGVAVITCGQGA